MSNYVWIIEQWDDFDQRGWHRVLACNSHKDAITHIDSIRDQDSVDRVGTQPLRAVKYVRYRTKIKPREYC